MQYDPSIQSGLQKLYREALLRGDSLGVRRAIDQLMISGLGIHAIYLEIITPTHTELGELWHSGSIGIADEHLATQITLEQMDLLKSLGKPRHPLGLKAAIGVVQDDQHMIGARIVSDFLYLDGWDAQFLGPDNPPEAIEQFVRDHRPHLLALSATLPANLVHLAKSIALVKSIKNRPFIIVGGLITQTDPASAAATGPDAVVSDPISALGKARESAGLPSTGPTLDQLLQQLGLRIQEYRKNLGLNQMDLALKAGMDRAYISSLENGKQNATLAVVLKLAGALGVPLEVLLRDGIPD